MREALALVGSPLTLHAVERVADCRWADGTLEVLDSPTSTWPTLPRCEVSAAAGRAGYDYLRRAIRLAMAREIDGIVTAPLNKEALAAAGVKHSGHTEILAGCQQHARLRDAVDGQGAARHPRHDARGAAPRAGPGHARPRAAARSVWPSAR
jgi:4-hydroxy-L-threonine phosphate dehydrogenase PdxA